MPKRKILQFSIENLLSPGTKKFRKGTLLFCVSENFRLRKSLWIRGRGGGKIKIFRQKFLSYITEKTPR